MLDLLWTCTSDYYLTFMLDATISSADLPTWKAFATQYVRARGTLPPIRVGNQPYGILPVTAIAHWQSPNPRLSADPKVGWIDILHSLRALWYDLISYIPTSVRPKDRPFKASLDPDKRLLDILTNEAISLQYTGRGASGPNYFNLFWRLVSPELPHDWRQQLDAKTVPPLQSLGLQDPTSNRLTNSIFSEESFEVVGPIVTNAALSETDQLPPDPQYKNLNYIQWLAQASPEEMFNRNEPFLLYKMLRHATLLAFVTAAVEYEFETKPGVYPNLNPISFKRRIEPELVDLEYWTSHENVRSVTLWRFLHDAPDKRDDLLMKLLKDQSTNSKAVIKLAYYLKELGESLGLLPTAALERLLSETLDLMTYRVDAWITACASYRLMTNRTAQQSSKVPATVIGGFGWVENLTPRAAADRPSEGYIHAPSHAHAVTATLLRSGYLSHNKPGADGPLAVNLSSARVRTAVELLDGVRSGRSFGALLGYRVERRLHDYGLDTIISQLRQMYPLLAGKLNPSEKPVESVAAENVLDGLALLEAWRPNPKLFDNQPHSDVISRILQELNDMCDAINDLGLAESVFQIVQGANPARAGAILDAISRGEQPPADIEFIRTPRTGTSLQHRLLVLFNTTTPTNPAYWAVRPRGLAEPHLNSWAAKLIGKPQDVQCTAHFYYPESDKKKTVTSITITLADLQLCPLDVVAWFSVNERASQTTLEQHVAASAYRHYATMKQRGWPDMPDLKLEFERQDPDVAKLTFPEVMELARAIRDVFMSSRPATSADLQSVITASTGNLAARANTALSKLKQLRNNLQACLTTENKLAPGRTLDNVRSALFALAGFNFPDAAPREVIGNDDATKIALVRQAEQLRDTANKMINDATGKLPEEQLATMFGDSFPVLNTFRVSYTNATLQTAIHQVSGVVGQEESTVIPWFQRIARVRSKIARLQQVLIYEDVLGYMTKQGTQATFQVAQLPVSTVPPIRWIGLDLPEGQAMIGGQISLVIYAPLGLNAQATEFGGLWIDGWDEVIPNANETSYVAFHYDAPSTVAPQSILIAAHPNPSDAWSIEMVRDILLETFQLTQIRAIDPHLLYSQGSFGQYFPALLFAYNRNHDTVETEFRS